MKNKTSKLLRRIAKKYRQRGYTNIKINGSTWRVERLGPEALAEVLDEVAKELNK